MSKLEVLVATMKQDDFSIVERMNITSSAVIANQHNRNDIETKEIAGNQIKMITTSTRGVGLNRNIALLASSAEYLLFADDDMIYYDGSLDGVVKAFDDMPQADVIIFSFEHSKDGKIYEKVHLPIKKLHWWNSMRYGTYAVAIRREAVIKNNITFNQLFGGGCIYSCGEDSLFIMDCFKSGLKVYSHSCVLGECKKDTSSWFYGYDKKYFHDKGVLFSFLFPKAKSLIIPIFAIKMKIKLKTEFSALQIFKLMRKGVKSGRKCLPYTEK